jgi:rod shape-determining protein MreD
MLHLVQRPIVRLVMVGMVFLTLQTTLLAELRPFDVITDILLGLSAAAGVVGGAEKGALVGFLFGIMFDLALVTPFGLSALTYGLVGFFVGLAKTSITVGQAWWLTMLLVFAGSAAGVVLFAALGTIVGEQGWVERGLLRVAVVVGAVNGLLGPLMLPLQRWTLRLKRDAT